MGAADLPALPAVRTTFFAGTPARAEAGLRTLPALDFAAAFATGFLRVPAVDFLPVVLAMTYSLKGSSAVFARLDGAVLI
jgi:hypothetical protein